MNRPTTLRRYGATAQALHWIVAGLIVAQYVLARTAAHLPLSARKLALLAEHKSVGMTVLILAVIRLAWKLKNSPPPLPTDTHPVERFLARVAHVSLYVLLFAMPLSGWLMSSAKNYSVSWFGAFTWPNLIAPNEAAFDFFKTLHHFLSNLLFAIASLHILAALKHHFWNKDAVLIRMLPGFQSQDRSS
jgi:cytochrome b561